MPSTRLIVIGVSALAGFVVWLLVRGNNAPRLQVVYGVGAFLGVYVLGNILVGFFQGIREAQQAPPPTPPSPPPGSGDANRP